MKKEEFSPRQFEALMREAAPRLKQLIEHSPDLSQERLANLKRKLEAHRPFLRVLTKREMSEVILEMFNTRPMDGSTLIDLILRNNVRLKDATGEGELYGLLRELENAKLIAGESRDGEKRYKLTELGRADNQMTSAKDAELAAWLLARAAA